MMEAPPGYRFIGPYIVPKPPVTMITRVQAAAAEHFGISIADLTQPTRGTSSIVRARQIAMHVTRNVTHRSFGLIGEKFGGRDHTTVQAAFRQIAGRIEVDPQVAADVRALSMRFEP